MVVVAVAFCLRTVTFARDVVDTLIDDIDEVVMGLEVVVATPRAVLSLVELVDRTRIAGVVKDVLILIELVDLVDVLAFVVVVAINKTV